MKQFLIVVLLAMPAFGQAWSGILDPSRAVDWSGVGIPGGLPDGLWMQCGSTIAAGASAATINAALAACPAQHFVLLGPGTFNLSAGIKWNTSQVVLRGSGPNSTFLKFSAGGSCYNGNVAICLLAPTNVFDNSGSVLRPCGGGGSSNCADWSAGYAQGSTSITLVNVGSSTPTTNTILYLDQANDATCPDSALVQGDSPTVSGGISCSGNAGAFGRVMSGVKYSQVEAHKVTSISCGGGTCTVGITPPIMNNNIRVGQTPGAWWNSSNMFQSGVENLTADYGTASLSAGTTMYDCYQCWISNVRDLEPVTSSPAMHDHWQLAQVFQSEIVNSYAFGVQSGGGNVSYGLEATEVSAFLLQNTIFDNISSPIILDNVCGNVFGYVATFDNLYSSPTFMQTSLPSHDAGNCMNLFEGFEGNALQSDNQHGASPLAVVFRSHVAGQMPNPFNKSQQTQSFGIDAKNRAYSVIGSVLGMALCSGGANNGKAVDEASQCPGGTISGSYHNQYEVSPFTHGGSNANCNTSIYSLGWGGTSSGCTNPGPTGEAAGNEPSLTSLSFMRWGNWDTVNQAVQWNSAEVPTTGITFVNGNPVPATHTLPASFYLASKPSWWGAMPFPAIGPDITGGDLAGVAGLAYRIPARVCRETTAQDSVHYPGTAIISFDANNCYSGATPPTAPNPDDTYCSPSQLSTMAQDGPAAPLHACVYDTIGTYTPATVKWTCPAGQLIPTDSPDGRGGLACDFATIAATLAAMPGNGCSVWYKIKSTNGTSLANEPAGTQNIYAENNLTIPAGVTCASGSENWITTDQYPNLPSTGLAEGYRATMAWVGTPSGTSTMYPAYTQPSSGNGIWFPEFRNSFVNFPTLSADATTSHLRIMGIEFTSASGVPIDNQMVVLPAGSDHIILDRVLVHCGDSKTNTDVSSFCSSGFNIAGNYIGVINSTIADFKCGTAQGTAFCPEGHGLGFGTSTTAISEGPYKIENNFISAGGEGILTGGGITQITPADAEIRRNAFYKPLYWDDYSCYNNSPIGPVGSLPAWCVDPFGHTVHAWTKFEISSITCSAGVITAVSTLPPLALLPVAGSTKVSFVNVTDTNFNQNNLVAQTVSVSSGVLTLTANTAGACDPSSSGGQITLGNIVIKNHFEAKNLNRFLIEGNTFTNNWQSPSSDQFGDVMNLNAIGLSGDTVAGGVSVQNGTIRFNSAIHANKGVEIGAEINGVIGIGAIGPFSIHDDLFDDLNGSKWSVKGDGRLSIMASWGALPYGQQKMTVLSATGSLSCASGVVTAKAYYNLNSPTFVAGQSFALTGSNGGTYDGTFTLATVSSNAAGASYPVATLTWPVASCPAGSSFNGAIAGTGPGSSPFNVAFSHITSIQNLPSTAGSNRMTTSNVADTSTQTQITGSADIDATGLIVTCHGGCTSFISGGATYGNGGWVNGPFIINGVGAFIVAASPTPTTSVIHLTTAAVAAENLTLPFTAPCVSGCTLNPAHPWSGVVMSSIIGAGGVNPTAFLPGGGTVGAANSYFVSSGAGAWCISDNIWASLQQAHVPPTLPYPTANPAGNTCSNTAGGHNQDTSDHTLATVGFANYNSGNGGGNYDLCTGGGTDAYGPNVLCLAASPFWSGTSWGTFDLLPPGANLNLLSQYLAGLPPSPPPPPGQTLTVTVTGTGVVVSVPAGIACPSTCSTTFTTGTPVTLTATPGVGFSFTGWSGACAGTGTCSVTMSAPRTVGATFTANIASQPVCNPPGGTFSTTTATACTSTGPVQCYNFTGAPQTNGTSGCTVGTKYIGPIPISASVTLFIVGGGTGFLDSPVRSYLFNVSTLGNIGNGNTVNAVQAPFPTGANAAAYLAVLAQHNPLLSGQTLIYGLNQIDTESGTGACSPTFDFSAVDAAIAVYTTNFLLASATEGGTNNFTSQCVFSQAQADATFSSYGPFSYLPGQYVFQNSLYWVVSNNSYTSPSLDNTCLSLGTADFTNASPITDGTCTWTVSSVSAGAHAPTQNGFCGPSYPCGPGAGPNCYLANGSAAIVININNLGPCTLTELYQSQPIPTEPAIVSWQTSVLAATVPHMNGRVGYIRPGWEGGEISILGVNSGLWPNYGATTNQQRAQALSGVKLYYQSIMAQSPTMTVCADMHNAGSNDQTYSDQEAQLAHDLNMTCIGTNGYQVNDVENLTHAADAPNPCAFPLVSSSTCGAGDWPYNFNRFPTNTAGQRMFHTLQTLTGSTPLVCTAGVNPGITGPLGPLPPGSTYCPSGFPGLLPFLVTLCNTGVDGGLVKICDSVFEEYTNGPNTNPNSGVGAQAWPAGDVLLSLDFTYCSTTNAQCTPPANYPPQTNLYQAVTAQFLGLTFNLGVQPPSNVTFIIK